MRYDSIDGDLKLTQRKKVLEDFKSPKGADILLMTLGTGAVGLVPPPCIGKIGKSDI